MDTTIRYTALVVFLLIVVALVIVLSDGIPIKRGRGRGPVIEGKRLSPMEHCALESPGLPVLG